MIALHSQLKDRLIKNDGEVLQELKQIFSGDREKHNLVIELSAQLNILRLDSIRGGLSRQDEQAEGTRIRTRILTLIDLITPEEAAAYELENAIFQRLLAVCKVPEREAEMRRLFPKNYYKQVEFDTSGAPLPEDYVNQFDLVIFDNFPHGEKDDPQDLLRYYLEKTKPYVLYFGAQLNLLWQFPEKAYFANSIFSIHARLEEMIKYVKYTRKPED